MLAIRWYARFVSPGDVSPSVKELDPATGQWASKTDMPEAWQVHWLRHHFDPFLPDRSLPSTLLPSCRTMFSTLRRLTLCVDRCALGRAVTELGLQQMSTGPMPTYANGEVIIPHAYKANTGVSTALKYNVRADSWEAGPSVAVRNGRYAVAFGTM